MLCNKNEDLGDEGLIWLWAKAVAKCRKKDAQPSHEGQHDTVSVEKLSTTAQLYEKWHSKPLTTGQWL